MALTTAIELKERILAVIHDRQAHVQKRLDKAMRERNQQFWADYFIDQLVELNQLEQDVQVRL